MRYFNEHLWRKLDRKSAQILKTLCPIILWKEMFQSTDPIANFFDKIQEDSCCHAGAMHVWKELVKKTGKKWESRDEAPW